MKLLDKMKFGCLLFHCPQDILVTLDIDLDITISNDMMIGIHGVPQQ